MAGRAARAMVSATAALALAACSQLLPLPPEPRSDEMLSLLGGKGSPPPEPPDFAQLVIPGQEKDRPELDMRMRGMREAAMAWGARSGQLRRSWEIAVHYSTRTAELDQAWDFRRVAVPAPMEAGWLLPPVVQRAGAVWSGGGRDAEAAVEYYEILRPGRISGRLPLWRDYLPGPGVTPEPPPRSLRPLPGEEKQWREWAAEGWRAGIALAEAELDEGLARLERDYTGMLEFRRLLAMGMISDIVVEAAHWPVVVDGGALRIGGRRVRIASDAEFVADSGSWRPQIVPVGVLPGG